MYLSFSPGARYKLRLTMNDDDVLLALAQPRWYAFAKTNRHSVSVGGR